MFSSVIGAAQYVALVNGEVSFTSLFNFCFLKTNRWLLSWLPVAFPDRKCATPTSLRGSDNLTIRHFLLMSSVPTHFVSKTRVWSYIRKSRRSLYVGEAFTLPDGKLQSRHLPKIACLTVCSTRHVSGMTNSLRKGHQIKTESDWTDAGVTWRSSRGTMKTKKNWRFRFDQRPLKEHI